MASPVSIFNTALARIGSSIFIQSETEKSLQNSVCTRFYEDVRNRVLSEYDWGFARRYAELQDVETPPVGWDYRFRYPQDCLKTWQVVDSDGCQVYAWQVVEDSTSDSLALTVKLYALQVVPLTIRYTTIIENPRLFSQKFTNCLGWALASEIAGPLAAKQEYVQAAGDAYSLALIQTMAQDQSEKKEPVPVSEYETARQ